VEVKLVTTQDWADPYNATMWPLQFLDMINAATSVMEAEFIQAYMDPCGEHCGPSSGYPHVPGTYYVLDALVPWVEKGNLPTQIMSTGAEDNAEVTRNLCPWPQPARYVDGSIDDWTSYVCA
jgi:feruloyl esterase